MAGDKVLVLGGTGPAGICLLRELLHRQHETITYVRSPGKIPGDLSSNPLLEVIKGNMEDTQALSEAISRSKIVLSWLGPLELRKPSPIPGYYSDVIKLMREHGVKNILAMATPSAQRPEDQSMLLVTLSTLLISLVAPAAFRAMKDIANVFQNEAHDLEWTVFRIAWLFGGHDEKSWKKDREDETFTGYVGDKEFRSWSRRGGLARWLVDCVENGQGRWIRQMPAVSNHGVREKTE